MFSLLEDEWFWGTKSGKVLTQSWRQQARRQATNKSSIPPSSKTMRAFSWIQANCSLSELVSPKDPWRRYRSACEAVVRATVSCKSREFKRCKRMRRRECASSVVQAVCQLNDWYIQATDTTSGIFIDFHLDFAHSCHMNLFSMNNGASIYE